ncbi:hypothetical protein HBB16_20190 [Pseudonocardia sp. MCCB 268]|nr:hypothetical protein [Pseudonocardia cytotoxica]
MHRHAPGRGTSAVARTRAMSGTYPPSPVWVISRTGHRRARGVVVTGPDRRGEPVGGRDTLLRRPLARTTTPSSDTPAPSWLDVGPLVTRSPPRPGRPAPRSQRVAHPSRSARTGRSPCRAVRLYRRCNASTVGSSPYCVVADGRGHHCAHGDTGPGDGVGRVGHGDPRASSGPGRRTADHEQPADQDGPFRSVRTA